MPAELDIRRLFAGDETISALSELLVEKVASGGSVSFMHPLALETAHAF